ncbi:MAG: DUF3368 domain-containing protein [Chloroherpetonaceae bacterium]|nr:DUF3368 domain-containing protein [Chloroherpetonaceae bacterium]MDW8467604.1 DUF3368 domain-containing protein [Chloroherpetonaceae bacterium]
MSSSIVCDASSLIVLDKIGELELLKRLFGQVAITPEVSKEFSQPLPEWIQIVEVQNKNYQRILEVSLGKGEASAIALSLEQEKSLLIIDDLRGRKYARELGIAFTGTLGIIADAKLNGYIVSAKAVLDKVERTNFRLSAEVKQAILKKCGEEFSEFSGEG